MIEESKRHHVYNKYAILSFISSPYEDWPWLCSLIVSRSLKERDTKRDIDGVPPVLRG